MKMARRVVGVVMTRYSYCYGFSLLLHFLFFVSIFNNSVFLYSLKLNVLQSNNLVSLIQYPIKRIKISKKMFDNYLYIRNLSGILFSVTFTLWLMLILKLSGDIHPNPGPNSFVSSDDDSASSNSDIYKFLNFPNHLSIVQYNVQSLLHKVDIISSELSCFDVIALTETWLSSAISSDDIHLENYHSPERNDRLDDPHGGVAVYIKDTLSYTRRHDLEINRLECVWVELKLLNNKNILVGVFYRPPSSNALYSSLINDSIGLAVDTGLSDIIITGDFNYNINNVNSERKVNEICQQYSLYQCIRESTHFTENTSSTIDLVFVHNKSTLLHSGVGEPIFQQNIRYHCPVFGIFGFQKPKQSCYERTIWMYDRADYDLFREKLNAVQWDSVSVDDIDTFTNNLTDTILNTAKVCIPNKNIKINHRDLPWINSHLKLLIRRRKRAYKRAKKNNTPENWSRFRKLRNETITTLRNNKSAYISSLSAKLKSGTYSSRDWWKTLKCLLYKSKKVIPPIMNPITGCITSNDEEKANVFNTYFAEQATIDDIGHFLPPYVDTNNQETLESILVDEYEVADAINSLAIGKSSGPDGINSRILRESVDELTYPLCKLFNSSLRCSTMPTQWKLANVCVVYKKGDSSLPSNYRPISLLNSLEKVFERIIFKHVYNFLVNKNFFTSSQSGFMRGDSTTCQLASLYNTFCKALDDGLEVRVVFFDISKAFDKVWHKGLLYKLHQAGIQGNLLLWFENYLNDRQQRVVLPGQVSDIIHISAGVPQGSILGPLLFLVYINDIVTDIDCNISLFADDTSLFITVNDPITSANIIQSDINKITAWANKWLVKFNPDKSETLLITRKKTRLPHPSLHMQNVDIPSINVHKHLGLYISNDCTWHMHIDHIRNKAWHSLNNLRSFKYLLDRRSLEIAYISFVRPILEYADSIWDNCTQTEKRELEQIQYEAARIVSGCSKLVSLHDLLTEIGWETLEMRRCKHKLVLFYKMINGLAPQYLSSIVPQRRTIASTYNLRNQGDFEIPLTRTNLYSNSFIPSVIGEWNALPEQVRTANTLSSFKYYLNRTKPVTNKLYYYGSRRLQIIHTRLRTKCSALRYHLYIKNIVDSPNCLCGMVETTKHFFFECNRYNHIRQNLLNTIANISEPSLNTILFGDDSKSIQTNKEIFQAVHSYIDGSKRFQT